MKEGLYWQEEMAQEALRLARLALKHAKAAGVNEALLQMAVDEVTSLQKKYRLVTSRARTVLSMVITKVLAMPYDQDHEFESDRLGLCMAVRAGYDARRAGGLLELLSKYETTPGSATEATWDELTRSHPYSADRLKYLRKLGRMAR